ARQAILIPAVSARPSMVVRQILPSIAVRTVVFTNGAPSALAEVGTPAFPVLLAPLALNQSDLFFSHAPLLRLLEWYMGAEVTVLRMEQHETPLNPANLTSIQTQEEQPFRPCSL